MDTLNFKCPDTGADFEITNDNGFVLIHASNEIGDTFAVISGRIDKDSMIKLRDMLNVAIEDNAKVMK